MKKEEYKKTNEIVLKQEARLLFQKFDHNLAFELSNYIIEKAKKENKVIAVSIRQLNGAIIFQYLMEGTNKKNQNWMNRKFNTVCFTRRSSFGAWLTSQITGERAGTPDLKEEEYAFCGGGFPICLVTGELVGVITISNLPHEMDHHFLVQTIAEWMKIEIPSIDLSYDYAL